MKLFTASELGTNIEDQKKEALHIENTTNKMNSEVDEIKAAIGGMKETGEYDNIMSAFESGMRSEVESTKRTEITEKANKTEKDINSNVESNQEMISNLDNNKSQLDSINSPEVVKGANKLLENSKTRLDEAHNQRDDIADKLQNNLDKLEEISKFAEKIEL